MVRRRTRSPPPIRSRTRIRQAILAGGRGERHSRRSVHPASAPRSTWRAEGTSRTLHRTMAGRLSASPSRGRQAAAKKRK